MLYIGIDPGESWCGFAALDVGADHSVRVEARSYATKAHGGYLRMVHDLLSIVPHNKPTCIIAEDFRIRRSGHQHFNRGDTLRLLGALEFGISCIGTFNFALIPPNDHGERETRELFGKVLLDYRQSWPRRRHPAWGHCLSAWRVLGNHLFHHETELLLSLLKKKRSHRCSQWLPALVRDPKHEHVAPAAQWIR